MEYSGILLDLEKLKKLSVELGKIVLEQEGKIYAIAGKSFNINSPTQLSKILFEELGLEPVKKTETGKSSTDEEVLAALANSHPLPAEILKYRTYSKLKNTYVDALPALVLKSSGRVHTSFNQTIAATGRLSSSDPNLQNIPIRDDIGREIPSTFISDKGKFLISADYSQIELRVLAHFCGDEAMKKAFTEKLDIHKHTASLIFKIPEAEVIDEMRRRAKSVNFGMIYGLQAYGLSRQLGITMTEAKEFIKNYFGNSVRSEFSKVFLKSYYLQILDEILKKSNKFSPKNLVEKFRNDDLKVRDIFRYKIMQSVEDRQPKDNYSSMGSNEVSILKRENEKKRKLKPIRDLLGLIPDLAFALKPCFMMSPLTVSQYINPKNIKFDVVLFDEASQIMPEDAVPCLIRSKQAIIMGDTQQLPPTSFFLNQDDESEEEIEDLESFLSESITKFRTKSLDWHYRSKNETLISFSNRFFYGNRLITFPNPKENDNSGLDFVYIKTGVYDRGKSRKNRVEAKEIVKIYSNLKKEYPKKSFGIIAFSMAQENAIREEFQIAGRPIEESIDVNNEEVFVKNLETVQGDERDIIILSVGYGKDSGGKFSYNFGPLNKEGGYKRLNVSITRSRFKTVVVSSILPDELDADKINVEGVKYLKDYLDFAKNKDFTKFLQKSEGIQFDSSFEEVVYEELKKEGFNVSCQIGCSGYRIDLAIKHPKKPGEYILGVECDGSQYHSSRFARDRDKIRQIVLENLGWNIIRIWSDDWLNNKEYEIEKIKDKVKDILKSKSISESKQNNCLSKIDEKEDFKEIELKDKYKEYKIVELSKSNINLEFDNYGSLNNYSAVSVIKKKILQVLEIESPIEKELLYKRVLSSMGIQKLGRRIENLFEEILRELKKENGINIYQNTISLEPVNILSKVKISKESDRPFILIPKEELGGAIIDILKNSFSITKEAITADIARGIYSNNRTGNKIRNKIEEAINYLIKNKLLLTKFTFVFVI
ncbi:DUF3320 domain-containing protein [Candidatus Woesearchaeota archaeon]|nr:DUF3320 domain-containing protein [Candidatus Woesearchaeota archaeon]